MSENPEKPTTLREKLILAGIKVIEENGVSGFSIRRTAAECGVSCAAPYKHFADQQELIQAIIDHINQEWYRRQSIIEKNMKGTRENSLWKSAGPTFIFWWNTPVFVPQL